MKLFFVSILFTSIISLQESFAQVGVLDSTFGFNGIKILTSNSVVYSLGIQSDNKIIIGGPTFNHNYALSRLNTNGTLDNSFGISGTAYPVFNGGDIGYSITIQQDDKIIVNGYNPYEFELTRYYPDGRLDSTFGSDGQIFKQISGTNNCRGLTVIVQPDGKIIQAGTATINANDKRFAIVRFKPSGAIDPTFGIFGATTTQIGLSESRIESLALQPDGKIVAGGYSNNTTSSIYKFAIVRYNYNGQLDATFGDSGRVEPFINDATHIYDIGASIAIQTDGKILMGGSTFTGIQTEFALLRFNSDGTFDSGFGNGGIVTTDFRPFININEATGGIALQQDGKIIVAGYASLSSTNSQANIAFVRYNADGNIDSLFGDSGKVLLEINDNEAAYAVTIQQNGKILIAGTGNNGMLVARYLSGLDVGILDLLIENNQILIYPNPIQSQATLQYTLTQEEKLSIELYDMQGKLVQSFISNETRAPGKHEEVLKLNELLPAGNYIISISNGKNSQGVKVVKE